MPTIELISIDCPKLPDLPRYESFAYAAGTKLRSHRSLFQSVFDKMGGAIVHLANKDLEGKEGGFWFAGKIMDWQTDDDALIFLPNTLRDIRDLMQRLIVASPKQRITFSTDVQCDEERRERGEITVSKFFDLHARRELRYNQLWFVKPDA